MELTNEMICLLREQVQVETNQGSASLLNVGPKVEFAEVIGL